VNDKLQELADYWDRLADVVISESIQETAAGMPVSVIGAWFHSPFFIALGIFVALTQVTHYYAHNRSRSRVIDAVVRFAQRARLIVPPSAHARHHKPPHSRDFCLLSGWNNIWLNEVISVWEWVRA